VLTVEARERDARLATLSDLVAGVQTLMQAAGVLPASTVATDDVATPPLSGVAGGEEGDGAAKSYSIESDGEY